MANPAPLRVVPASAPEPIRAAAPLGARLLERLASAIARASWSKLARYGNTLAWVAGSLLRIRRAHVERALTRAGLDRGAARAMYRSLGRGVFELLWMARRAPSDAIERVTFDAAATSLLTRLRSESRGVVIAASHTGNWDLAACAVASRLPLVVVTKRLSMRAFDHFWQTTRAAFGVRLAFADAATKRARHALAHGQSVALMIDQVPARKRHGVEGTFLGAPAWLDKTPATIAARAGAPLVVAASRRRDDGDHEVSALLVLEPPPDAGPAWIVDATHRANAALESFVRKHPESWLWMHRRWKTPART